MNVIIAEEHAVLELGYAGEKDRTQVRFYYGDVAAEFPGGTIVLQVRRPWESNYHTIAPETEDGYAIWTVWDYDLAIRGSGECQLVYSDGNVIAKKKVWTTSIDRSIEGSDASIPEDWEDIEEAMVTAAGELAAESAALREKIDSYDDMTAQATGLPAGSTPTAEIDHSGEAPVLKLGIPKGDKGDTGADGAPGADGHDGAQGPEGPQGPQGPAGKDGKDGKDGDPTTLIDDTAGTGDTTKVWSADKSSSMATSLSNEISELKPTATNTDIGKALILKTIDQSGKPTSFEYGEAGGGANLPTEETAQELLEYEQSNTGLTDIVLMVIGQLFDNLPQNETATDILHSLELECERLDAIYTGWIAERVNT